MLGELVVGEDEEVVVAGHAARARRLVGVPTAVDQPAQVPATA